MTPIKPQALQGGEEEIFALAETLRSTERRLKELTGGEVDTVLDRDGQPLVLRHIREHLRRNDALRQATVLDALPAQVAVLDSEGRIVAVNQAWQRFVDANAPTYADMGIGASYLDACERAQGAEGAAARQAAAGIRAIQNGGTSHVSLEYLWRSPTRQHWFLLTISPLADALPNGVVVMRMDISERKQRELEVLAAKSQLQATLDAIPDLLFEMGLDGRYYSCHTRNAELLAAPAEGLIGRTVAEILPAPATEIVLAALREANAKGYSVGKQFQLALPQGVMTFELSAAPMAVPDGQPERFICVSRDITERKRAEEDLRESERRFGDLMEQIDLAAVMFDTEARITYCNSFMLRLIGWRSEEVLGRSLFDIFIPPELQDMKVDFIPALLANHSDTWHHENEIITRSGERRLIRWSNLVLHSRDAAVSGVAAIGEDVTEQRNSERAARESERAAMASRAESAVERDIAARLQAILDTVVDGVITIDALGKVQTFNPAAERIFGYAADEVVGRNINMLMPEPYHGDHDACLARYRTTHEARIIGTGREVMGLRKDGSTFPLDLSISEMTLGDECHYTGVVRDITERKAAEREVAAARVEAERANSAKKTFLANMSHEIRTPMNGVIGMIEVLQQSSLSGPQMEMADIIRESSFALLEVIDNILDFSKIEAGKLDISHIPISVADVVEKTCEVLDSLAQKKKVELTLFTDPAIPGQVLGDPGRLRQILINLTNNAIKFSSGTPRPGRVSVRALCVESGAEGVRVEFQVSDNGIGIDKESLARIFAPFEQADTSITRKYGGTGLGLVISRQLADMMGGNLRVESEPGVGSLFSLNLPFGLPPEQADAVRQPCLLAGLPCLVLGYPDGMAGDLAAYLAHDGAGVERTTEAAIARQWIASRPSGRAVVVIDTRAASTSLEVLRATARAHPQGDIHFVVIRRGLRRGLREEDSHLVSVDGNILTRRTLLDAVAVAAGLARAPALDVFDRPNAPAPSLSAERVQRRSGRILVAEDNEFNQRVILLQLGLLGYVADFAGDGLEALARWREGNHVLLLTDLQMPNMDGYELASAIRQAEGDDQHLPVVALTANAQKSEELRCKAAGMDDYLTKPVRLKQLQAVLEKWLPVPGQGEAAAEVVAAPPASRRFAVLDRAVLPEQIGHDPAQIAQFLEGYRRSAQQTADEIRTAIALGDWKAASLGAHKLKSSSRAVGALALGEVCHRLEQAGKDGDADAVPALAAELEATLAAALDAMNH